jgi:hypothetical protein
MIFIAVNQDWLSIQMFLLLSPKYLIHNLQIQDPHSQLPLRMCQTEARRLHRQRPTALRLMTHLSVMLT